MTRNPPPARVAVKLFFQHGAAPDPDEAIPMFHRWIRERTVDGVLIDVADYRHVRHGPAVILVAHEGHYRLDRAGGRPGLEYELKRGATGSWPARLTVALGRVLAAGAALAHESLSAPVQIRTDALRIRVPDRLAAPNTEATRDALTDGVLRVARHAFGDEAPRVVWEREAPAFTVTVQVSRPATIDALAARLQPAGEAR